MNKLIAKTFIILNTVFLLIVPLAYAAEDADITAITEPLNKIYDLLKTVVSTIAVIAITVAGAMYMFSGGNIQARESAKGMVSYAIVGLIIVWIAPLIVNFLTAA